MRVDGRLIQTTPQATQSASDQAKARAGDETRAPLTAPQLPGRNGTIRVFEGNTFRTIPPASDPPTSVSGKNTWGQVGVLSHAMLGDSSGFGALRGQAHEKNLEGGDGWRAVASFGPGAWSLDVTAQLLSGKVRC